MVIKVKQPKKVAPALGTKAQYEAVREKALEAAKEFAPYEFQPALIKGRPQIINRLKVWSLVSWPVIRWCRDKHHEDTLLLLADGRFVMLEAGTHTGVVVHLGQGAIIRLANIHGVRLDL